MDIRIAIARTSIFLVVYSLVLGVPFWLGFQFGLWQHSTWIIFILASAGPYIYSYLKKETENRLLAEQKQYQRTLQQASLGMTGIREEQKLLGLIAHILSKTVRVEYCAVYVYDEAEKKYQLKARRGGDQNVSSLQDIGLDHPIADFAKYRKGPFVRDEVLHQIHMKQYTSRGLLAAMDELKAELVVPCFLKDNVSAFIVMGKKKSRAIYSEEDLMVFSILSGQVALAIENAQFYDKAQRTQARLLKADKMATIGTMADGLSHQMNNRLNAMGFIVSELMDSVSYQKKKTGEDLPLEWKGVVEELEHGFDRLKENVKRGGEIVHGLLKYTRAGDKGFEPVDFNDLFAATLEMLQFKIRLQRMYIEKIVAPGTPKIRGNFTQLQEVFFNMIDNAYDAMMERKEKLKEEGYSPQLTINVAPQQFSDNVTMGQCDNENAKEPGKDNVTMSRCHTVTIQIKDNGIGVKEEDQYKLFTPFFTTKASSNKGTGLGLYVMHQLIEEGHGGTIKFDSVYGQGSTITITLPAV